MIEAGLGFVLGIVVSAFVVVAYGGLMAGKTDDQG